MPRSPSRRFVTVLVAVVVATTCVALGFWQLRRLHDRRILNAEMLAQRSGPVVRVDPATRDLRGSTFRPAVAAGTYDTPHEVLVFGRPLDGEPGHLVVTPLVLTDGSAVLVIRGWVPFALQRAPVTDAAPVSDEVTVRGYLVPDEGDGSDAPDADGVVRTLDVRGIASTLPYDVAPLAIQLTRQTPPQRGELPISFPLPELSEGPHLSYAIQWFTFATIALVGCVILLRRDRSSPTATP